MQAGSGNCIASGLPYREIAIFYRLQNQSEIFEHVFEKEGIPFEVSLKKTVKDIPVLDWLIKVLRFLSIRKIKAPV